MIREAIAVVLLDVLDVGFFEDLSAIWARQCPKRTLQTDCIRNDHLILSPDGQEMWAMCNVSFEIVVLDTHEERNALRVWSLGRRPPEGRRGRRKGVRQIWRPRKLGPVSAGTPHETTSL